jgi:mono/diheme cytochrome c family protein
MIMQHFSYKAFARLTARWVITGCALGLTTFGAAADDKGSKGGKGGREGDTRGALAPKIYKSECASCHTAYPAGLLVEADWRKLLSGLATHFGTDASVTAAELQEVSAYLLPQAATDATRYTSKVQPPRLTQTAWFERKHQRKIPDSVWQDPRVKSAANCAACHTRADQGSFAERDISVPGFPGKHW